MKKIIIILFIVVVLLSLTYEESNTVLIPDNAIRFRIIANSNSKEDQNIKQEIKDSLEPILTNILTNSTSKEETKELINESIPSIKDTLNTFNISYNINYGLNYFPIKEYKNVNYPEGNYESLVITLGEGLGDNWWCVLFPPLCLLEANESDYDEYTYSFYIKDLIDKYL